MNVFLINTINRSSYSVLVSQGLVKDLDIIKQLDCSDDIVALRNLKSKRIAVIVGTAHISNE